VQQADLHVQRDALQLDRVQVGQQVDRRAGLAIASHSATPMAERSCLRQRRKVVPAPVVCWASSREQWKGCPRLLQHLSLRQPDQLVAHGEALAGPGLQVPLPLKGFKGLLEERVPGA
jgi:hypothetical protein